MYELVSVPNIHTPSSTQIAQNDRQKSCFHGRAYLVAHRSLDTLIDKVKLACFRVFFAFTAICEDPLAMFLVLRRLQGEILPYLEMRKGIPKYYHKLNNVLASSIIIFDSIQLAADLNYFANSKFKKDSHFYIAGKVALIGFHLEACSRWLTQMGLLNMERIAGTMGKVRLVKLMSSFSTGLLCVSFVCNAVDAVAKLLLTGSAVQHNFSRIELASNIADLTLNVLAVSGGVSLGALCIVSCASIALRIFSETYKKDHKKELA